MITGVLMGATDTEIQLKDDKGIRHTISMDDVEQKRKQKLSLMPADLHKELSEQDLVDVVEYMTTLKK
jgi:putative heme-binding domain-containing protein